MEDGPVKADFNINDRQNAVSSFNVFKHSLSGSPDYTANAGITIHHPQWPNLSVVYQQTDDYLHALGSGNSILLPNGNTVSSVPDYWVDERNQLDLQVSQNSLNLPSRLLRGSTTCYNLLLYNTRI